MTTRLNLFGNPTATAAKAAVHFGAANRTILQDSSLPAATLKLVLLRASQINGDGYATDVWTKNAAAAGESATRLNLVAAWRESTVFTDAERAALELTEEGTRIADAHPRRVGRDLGPRTRALHRRPDCRTRLPDRHDQRQQPAQRDRPQPRRLLPARSVRRHGQLTAAPTAGARTGCHRRWARPRFPVRGFALEEPNRARNKTCSK